MTKLETFLKRIDSVVCTVSRMRLCEENGIYFISMTERFLNEYAKDYTIPYGFMNTSVAKGHLNENGHRMLADEVYRLITRIEAQS